MTDLETLLRADEAAHRYFDRATRGEPDLDADAFAIEAYADAVAGTPWWRRDSAQQILFRYRFAATLLALGLGQSLRARS